MQKEKLTPTTCGTRQSLGVHKGDIIFKFFCTHKNTAILVFVQKGEIDMDIFLRNIDSIPIEKMMKWQKENQYLENSFLKQQ